MSHDAARVVALHKESGINCSQAMLSVYGKYFGLSEELAIKVATAFGGGMAGMGKTCGAVTGAFMVLGLTSEPGNPSARSEVYSLVQEFSKRFIARNGSISCNEMLGFDMSTPEGLSAIREKKLVSFICPILEQNAAEIVEELLGGRLPVTPD